MGKPEVLVVMMVPRRRNCSTRVSRLRLISRFSETASMIQSASASFAEVIFKIAGAWISRLVSGVKKEAGRDLRAASRPACTMRFRVRGSPSAATSNRRHGIPALARCAAMRRPHGARAEYRSPLDSLCHNLTIGIWRTAIIRQPRTALQPLLASPKTAESAAWKKSAIAPAHRWRVVASKYTEGPNPSAVTLQRPCHCEIG